MLIVPESIVRRLRGLQPSTHEVAGVLLVDAAGLAKDVKVTSNGGACRAKDGTLIRGEKCTVHLPPAETGAFVFHTHPRSNRPSSLDLRTASLDTTRTHLVVTPLGIWAYRGRRRLRPEEVAEVRFVGHMEQNNTQSGNCSPYCAFLSTLFEVQFFPFSNDSTMIFFHRKNP